MFLDESGANTAMDRTHGRALQRRAGRRARPARPLEGDHPDGGRAARRRPGGGLPGDRRATDSVCFAFYVEHCLAPALRPGDIVVMDNLGLPQVRRGAAADRLGRGGGAGIAVQPRLQPDRSDVLLKAWLRSAAARTVGDLIEAMGDGLRAVRPADIRGWFAHSGYPGPGSSDTLNKKPL
ncbi:MAG: hypothetical protein U0800_07580 [Isosphaeraceae bacterium]